MSLSQFSRATIFEAFNALPLGGTYKLEHAPIREFALRFGLEAALEHLGNVGVRPKMTALAEYVIHNPDAKGPRGSSLAFEIIEYALKEQLKPRRYDSCFRDPEDVIPSLAHALKADGFVIDGDRLIPDVPEELDLSEAESRFESLLNHYGFTVPKGHLDQARAAYVRGEWASANGQLRSFVEGLFHDMAVALGGKQVKSGFPTIQYLASEGIIDAGLNEIDTAGNGFVPWFWRRLHPQGPHPGLSDKQDSTLRFRLVLVVMSHYLDLFAAKLP